MRLWAYVLAILATFSAGWMAHSAHYNQELANAIQKAEQRYQTLRTRQETERASLESQIASDRQKSEQRLRMALAENQRLREDAARPVDISFLVYSRLCESPDDCAVYYSRTEADGTTQALPAPTALDLYATLRDVTDAIQQHNLQIEQINQQIRECRK